MSKRKQPVRPTVEATDGGTVRANNHGRNQVPRTPGGRRLGAGRKADKVKAIVAEAKAGKAIDYLEQIEALAASSDSDKVKLAALIYLVDRELGKPKLTVDNHVIIPQAVNITTPLTGDDDEHPAG